MAPFLMVTPLRIAGCLIEDAFRWVTLLLRSKVSVRAENLFLRCQLALYTERGMKPGRIDAVTRASLVVLSHLFDWRSALVVVQPATLLRWRRAGWKLLRRRKARRGRPPIPEALRALFRRMANENFLWGEERIANELLLKLGIRVSPRTVRKYMPKRPPGQPHRDQRWSTFLKNHAMAILACDLFVDRGQVPDADLSHCRSADAENLRSGFRGLALLDPERRCGPQLELGIDFAGRAGDTDGRYAFAADPSAPDDFFQRLAPSKRAESPRA